MSAAAGGFTAWKVAAPREGSVQYIEREVERTPALGTHFTSYQAEQYPDLTYAAENAVKAVVNIEAVQQVEMPRRRGYDPFLEFFGIPQGYDEGPQFREQRAGGSGVIISEDGYVVTNNHVVDGASKLKVKLNDGRTFEAKLIGKDSATDLALLKIEAADLPTVPFGSSDALRLGEWVLAIGSPFDLQSTITAGIVSAKARNLGVIPNDFSIEAFIQTDAAVNPGNSGGALVNTHGELVGINTLIKSQTGSYVGYSFAIPESIVRKVVVDLKEYGIVQRALLGIRYGIVDQDFIDNMGEETGIKELGGAYVSSVVEGGSASEAGIRKGDVILDIDGVKINDNATLSEQIGRRRPNDKVKLSVRSSLNDNEGTYVKEVKQVEKMLVRGVTRDNDCARIALCGIEDTPGKAFEVFSLLSKHGISVDLIIQSIGNGQKKDISFTVTEGDCEPALKLLQGENNTLHYDDIKWSKDVSKVSIVGTGMMSSVGVASKMFEALYDENININMISTSEIKVSVLVDQKDAERAVVAIHDKFMI